MGCVGPTRRPTLAGQALAQATINMRTQGQRPHGYASPTGGSSGQGGQPPAATGRGGLEAARRGGLSCLAQPAQGLLALLPWCGRQKAGQVRGPRHVPDVLCRDAAGKPSSLASEGSTGSVAACARASSAMAEQWSWWWAGGAPVLRNIAVRADPRPWLCLSQASCSGAEPDPDPRHEWALASSPALRPASSLRDSCAHPVTDTSPVLLPLTCLHVPVPLPAGLRPLPRTAPAPAAPLQRGAPDAARTRHR